MKIKITFSLLVVLSVLFSCCAVRPSSIKTAPKTDEQRIVPVIVVADESFYSKRHNWIERGAKTILRTSDKLKKQCGIVLEIQIFARIELNPELYVYAYASPVYEERDKDSRIHRDVLALTQQVSPLKNGIVIWLSSRVYGLKFGDGCVDKILGQYAVVTDEGRIKSIKKLSKIMLHEVAHLFGAKDINNPNSIMSDSVDLYFTPAKLDNFNKQIILQNKWRNFEEEKEQSEQH